MGIFFCYFWILGYVGIWGLVCGVGGLFRGRGEEWIWGLRWFFGVLF